MAKKPTDPIQKSAEAPDSGRDHANVVAYEKPRILFRQTLEAAAAVCDPGAGGKAVVPDDCNLFAGS